MHDRQGPPLPSTEKALWGQKSFHFSAETELTVLATGLFSKPRKKRDPRSASQGDVFLDILGLQIELNFVPP
jgi:hypothetical protein